MKTNVYKIELLFLFSLTILSFISFYFQDSIPDTFYSISSEGESSNLILYWLGTLILSIGKFSGPWLFFPFFLSAFFYGAIFAKRNFYLDVFAPVLLIFFFLSLSHVAFPEFMGDSIHFLMNKYVSFSFAVLVLITSFIFFVLLSFKNVVEFNRFLSLTVEKSKAVSNLPSKVILSSKNKMSHALSSSIPQVSPKLKFSFSSFTWPKTFISKLTFLKKKVSTVEGPSTSFAENTVDDFDDFDFDGDFDIDTDSDIEEKKSADNSKVPVLNTQDERRPLFKRINELKKRSHEYFSQIKKFPLRRRVSSTPTPADHYFERVIGLIEDKMNEFNIDGKIINVLKGPVVDTYELELGLGVKVSKVRSISEDLSLALYGAPIRIVYQMKGRATMGIEVPRNPRQIIFLDEILSSQEYKSSNLFLPIAMGKNAFGESFVVDLAAMPHMLVAGATGAGKSVFINALLVSLLMKKTPDEMKLILIDPKQLELALYAKLPHLVMPVVTDAKMASIALMWATEEMEKRYSMLKELGVRNIAGYNEKVKAGLPEDISKIAHFFDNGDTDQYSMPYLVIIIDEFADLILTKSGKEIENNVCRIAAKARAAGIHLVVATQRPSVDVITGLIKSNFPTRVSFRVTSSIDSRTILNAVGAESLLGKGDMLYKFGIETLRVHSSFIEEKEIEVFMDCLTDCGQNFNQAALEFIEAGGAPGPDSVYVSYGASARAELNGPDNDPLMREAIKVVCEHGSASASMLQRRLRVGYNRAANLIEELERKGIVGPAVGAKPRKVLMSGEAETSL